MITGEIRTLEDCYDSLFDETDDALHFDEYERLLVDTLLSRFESFEYVNKRISRTKRVLLENKMFYILCEDDQFGLIVELIPKQNDVIVDTLQGLQMTLYYKYFRGIEDVLLEINSEIRIHTNASVCGIILKG